MRCTLIFLLVCWRQNPTKPKLQILGNASPKYQHSFRLSASEDIDFVFSQQNKNLVYSNWLRKANFILSEFVQRSWKNVHVHTSCGLRINVSCRFVNESGQNERFRVLMDFVKQIKWFRAFWLFALSKTKTFRGFEWLRAAKLRVSYILDDFV